MPEHVIRPAEPSEAALLTELAMRSKAVWGYDAAFMRRCRPLLTVTPEYIRSHPVWVAEAEAAVTGFYSLRELAEDVVDLDLLFVEPRLIGRGVGAKLMAHAVAEARRLGYARMVIESDPGAEPFYLRQGARRTGSVASTVEAGRFLPTLEIGLLPPAC